MRAFLVASVAAVGLWCLPAHAEDQPEAPAPTPAPVVVSAPKSPRNMTAVYIAGGGAAACFVAGTVFGISALSQSSDYKSNPTSSAANHGEATALAADVLFGFALTFAVTSAVFLFSKNPTVTAWLERGTSPVRF
jgi:hypothetical protein